MGIFDKFKSKRTEEKLEFYEDHPKDDQLAYDLIKNATKLKRDGDLSKAIENIQQAIKFSSSYDSAKDIKLANYLFEHGQIQESFRVLNQAILKINKLFPYFAWGQVAEIYHQLGILNFKNNRYEDYIFYTYCSVYFNYLNLSYMSDQKHFEDVLSRETTFIQSSNKLQKAFNQFNKPGRLQDFDKGFKEFIDIISPMLTEINQYMVKSTRGNKFINIEKNKRMIFLNDFLNFNLYQKHYKKELKKYITN